MNFLEKLKDFFKQIGRSVKEATQSAAEKIAKFGEKTKLRIKKAFETIEKKTKNAFCASENQEKAKNSDAKQNSAGSAEKSDFAQSESRKSDSTAEKSDNAQHTETSGETKSETKSAEFQRKNDAGQSRIKARRFFVHFTDILAGLLFFSAVVVALKPDLLGNALRLPSEEGSQTGIPRFVEITDEIGSYLIKIKIMPMISPGLEVARNSFIVLFLALYIALKFTVLLLAKNQNSQKIVSVLMIALTILACALLAENFWIFIMICLIASFAFAFSCGFAARTIFKKFAVFVALAACYYTAAHILTNYENCHAELKNAGNALVLFGKSIIDFFKTLRI